MEFHEGVKVDAVAREGGGIAVMLGDGSKVAASHLLLATGRAPRLAALDLVVGQVDATPRGITTDAGHQGHQGRQHHEAV